MPFLFDMGLGFGFRARAGGWGGDELDLEGFVDEAEGEEADDGFELR